MPVLFIGLFLISSLSVLVLIFIFPAVSMIKALFYFHS